MALALFVVSLAWGNGLPLHGNIHDIFIWLNAGQFIASGMKPHVDFSSPLGALYLYANHGAWLATNIASNIPLITGPAVATLFVVLVLLYRKYLRRWMLVDVLMLTILISISGRQMGLFEINLSWYGNYNRYCWAAVLLLVLLINGRNQALLQPNSTDRIRIAVLAGLLLTFTLFIKVNFFIGLGVIYFGWMVASGAIRDLRTWAVPSAIVGAGLGIAVLCGISVDGYLRDILMAGEARRSSAAPSLLRPDYVVVVGIFLGANVLLDRLIQTDDGLARSRLILNTGLSAGIFLALLGDYAKPFEIYAIVLGFRVLDLIDAISTRAAREPVAIVPLTAFPFAITVIFFAVELYTLSLMSAYRLGVAPASRLDRVSWSAQVPGGKRIDLLVSNEASTLMGGYAALAKIIAPSPDRNRIVKELSANPLWISPFTNKSYVPQIDEALEVLRTVDGLQRMKVFPLVFSNPFPFLLGARSPTPALLWLHDGTTFNGDDSSFFDRQLADSDIVMTPHGSVDLEMSTLLKDMFNEYNRRTRSFCEFHTGLFWSFYRRCTN